ncbi:unnamed protein product [Cuscuta europaea]|uniref:Glycosyltransferase n=1 Tax=Cuscuta europaea TaxID=41803 RepID=A0A9P1EFA9_CUSEU|nr:unnamed protein product [Cuscuta europaea]
MDMEKQAEIIAVPFPYQGHTSPMLQFCRLLMDAGACPNVTLVLTHDVAKSIHRSSLAQIIHTLELISDGNDGGGVPAAPPTFEEYREHVQAAVSEGVAAVIKKRKRAKLLVFDSMMPWLAEIGRARGLRAAALFTQSASVCSIYYHMLQGRRVGERGDSDSAGAVVSLPALPVPMELPSFSLFGEIAGEVEEFTLKQARNMGNADCLLFNTFDALEKEAVKWLSEKWAIKTIGPLVPRPDNKIDLYKSDHDQDCMKWLDAREPSSVVYASFGTVVVWSEQQMQEIAMGLAQSNKYFIWAVRDSEQSKIPKNFKPNTAQRGLILKWCPQVKVLSHKAVACFLTHCGWNSTLEALSLGVPVVAMPQMVDQPTNAKFIDDVWRVGIRVRVNERGIVTRQEVNDRILEVMEGVRADEIKRNAVKWKGLAGEALMEGGSSYVNIKNFISQLAM